MRAHHVDHDAAASLSRRTSPGDATKGDGAMARGTQPTADPMRKAAAASGPLYLVTFASSIPRRCGSGSPGPGPSPGAASGRWSSAWLAIVGLAGDRRQRGGEGARDRHGRGARVLAPRVSAAAARDWTAQAAGQPCRTGHSAVPRDARADPAALGLRARGRRHAAAHHARRWPGLAGLHRERPGGWATGSARPVARSAPGSAG